MRCKQFVAVLSTLFAMNSLSSTTNSAKAHEMASAEQSKFSLNVTLNSDSFFGFYPFFSGAYHLTDSADFTFYGVQWSGGTGINWGNWTEFGVGGAFALSHGFSITPQLGLLNGSLTSAHTHPRALEGLVPNITIKLNQDLVEGEFYMGLYYGFKGNQDKSNNYLHSWLNAGFKATSFFSVGGHVENLRYLGGQNQRNNASYNYYWALAPYVQFADPKGGSYVRFLAGPDLRDTGDRTESGWMAHSFYKLIVGMNF
jgi:hypothetical protein